jgi:hypothetical protein
MPHYISPLLTFFTTASLVPAQQPFALAHLPFSCSNSAGYLRRPLVCVSLYICAPLTLASFAPMSTSNKTTGTPAPPLSIWTTQDRLATRRILNPDSIARRRLTRFRQYVNLTRFSASNSGRSTLSQRSLPGLFCYALSSISLPALLCTAVRIVCKIP